MKFRVQHLTRYEYTETVSLCQCIAHLKPIQTRRQHCLASQVRVDPWPAVSRDHEDFFGNRVSYFSIQQAHLALEVTAISEIELAPLELPAPERIPSWEQVRARLYDPGDPLMTNARIFSLPSAQAPLDAAARDFAAISFTPGRPILEAALDLTHRIFTEFDYDPASTTVATPVAEVMQQRRGVCQDFAHIAIAGLRGLGLPARYVSGYLETLPPPGQVKLRGADASHAWLAILIPDFGWVDLDPTNDQITGDQHITTAIGRDFQDVTPLRGIFYGGGSQELRVAVDVDRIGPPAASAPAKP